MSSPILPSLQIARLLVRKGDLHEARVTAEDARLDALILDDRRQWLEASRIFFQCCQELEEVQASQTMMDEILKFLGTNPEMDLQAMAETILGSWLLALRRFQESQDYVQSAMNKAMQCRDLETLARSLSVYAFSMTFDANKEYAKVIEQINKLDVIIAEIDNPEIQLYSRTMRCFVYSQKGQPDLALPLLWESYELAKSHGFQFHTSSLLAQIARVHRDLKQEDEYRLYSELALKGLDHRKMPRLYKLIQQLCPPSTTAKKSAFDFQIDETGRRVREKTKGLVDFKNQHILFEMALLFIKKPGARYNKEDLAQAIWNQAYEPDLHDNLIYVSIKRLRTLLEPDLESPKYILRDRKGYYFNPQAIVQMKNAQEITV